MLISELLEALPDCKKVVLAVSITARKSISTEITKDQAKKILTTLRELGILSDASINHGVMTIHAIVFDMIDDDYYVEYTVVRDYHDN